MPTDYAAVAYLYSENRPTLDFALPAVEERRVTDPARVVFTPGWNVPIHSFSIQNASLAKKTVKLGTEESAFCRYAERKRTCSARTTCRWYAICQPLGVNGRADRSAPGP